MDRERAKEYVRVHLEDYLRSKGINTCKPFRCLNPAHEDKNPSMSYDSRRQKVKCFACEADYDIFDLIGIDYCLSGYEAMFAKAYELYNVSVDKTNNVNHLKPIQQNTKKPYKDCAKEIEEAQKHIYETDYPSKRGLSPEAVKRFKLGFNNNFWTRNGEWKALIIPTSQNTYTARNTDINAEEGNRIQKRKDNDVEVPLFNLRVLEGDKPVFICEGEIDAMSFWDVGADAVALGSVSSYKKLLQYIDQNKLSCSLILALDNDAKGREYTAKLEPELQKLGLVFYKADVEQLYLNKKDANEALRESKEAFKKEVWQTLKDSDELLSTQAQGQAEEQDIQQEKLKEKYLSTSAASYLDAFSKHIQDNANVEFLSTGFKDLDEALDGGLFGGLYVIGAISSLGKTTLALQIADNIAKQGRDVLYISLEMSRYEIMAKSVSRETLLYCLNNEKDSKCAKTARGILTGKRYSTYSVREAEVIHLATKEYKKYANKLYIIEGVGNIGAAKVKYYVERHECLTGQVPVVIVDYLQILSPGDQKATDKQNTDKAVLELKRIGRDFNTPTLAISSLNRESYKDPVSMAAFKESGAIEYSSDVLIGLQLKGVGDPNRNGFDVDLAKSKTPREIELKILKNRNGPTGGVVPFNYYPMFNLFEIPKQNLK